MEVELAVLCLIGTALTTCAVTLIMDAVALFKRPRGRATPVLPSPVSQGTAPRAAAEAFPHPIAHGYPMERMLLPWNVIPINRTARAQAQLRISGAAMSEMRALLEPDRARPLRSWDFHCTIAGKSRIREEYLQTPGSADGNTRRMQTPRRSSGARQAFDLSRQAQLWP
ncbi:MAG TPA: hypothetical protein VGP20_01425, partial [Steroidobacteraceae bacterium]|nr:hypothetical protein [Steroidobacteraceae bacterium]